MLIVSKKILKPQTWWLERAKCVCSSYLWTGKSDVFCMIQKTLLLLSCSILQVQDELNFWFFCSKMQKFWPPENKLDHNQNKF